MTRRTLRTPAARRGFTLIEMLIVLALMVLLASLAAGVAYSGVFGSQKVIGAADRASGWLIIAKQRAMRDRAPRGVRFLASQPDPTNRPAYFELKEAQYIEQPDAWVPNELQEGNPTGGRIVMAYTVDGNTPGKVTGQKVFFVGTAADINEFNQRVTAGPTTGDMLVLPEFGGAYRVLATADDTVDLGGTNTNTPCKRIDLGNFPDLSAAGSTAATPSKGTLITYKFAFQPAPQPLLGEPLLQLTGGAAIDFRNAGNQTSLGVALTGTQFDVLFGPSGQVLGTSQGMICLWVRDPEKVLHPREDNAAPGTLDDKAGYNAAGEQSLVCVYTRTGFIATQPVKPQPYGPAPDGPYQFAKDGINSGF